MRLPTFDVDDYRRMLTGFVDAGFSFAPAGALRDEQPDRVLYLRHDVDFDPPSALPVAEAEAEMGIRSTYYVLLTQHYNALQLDNRRAIRHLAGLGHEIGLHYDMQTYPGGPEAARAHLDHEVAILATLAGAPVSTISMHQPSRGEPDPFLTVPEYVHPHDPSLQQGLLYVSDSCRAWRDTSLVSCAAASGPQRILLNTHPELWLDGSQRDRMAYLAFLRDRVTGQYRTYFDTVVRDAWLGHPGSRLHDERESSGA